MEKNNCYECPLRQSLDYSAHSKCNLFQNDLEAEFLVSMQVMSGAIKSISGNNKVLLSFNQHGVENGWCAWPLNFDPVWVECKIDVEKIMEEREAKENDRSINQ
jgi:hypothetical protein